jgi:hypothetical protein
MLEESAAWSARRAGLEPRRQLGDRDPRLHRAGREPASSQARECGALTRAQSLRNGNQEISTQCVAAVDVARRPEQASKAGQSALADLVAGMDGLQRETRAATVKIKRLGERSM